MIILTAIAAMIAATLIQHLGLAEAIAKVVTKVASCNQCCTFWFVLAVLVYCHHDIVVSVMLSILMAYASNWFVLLLMCLQRLFTYWYEKREKERGG
jgi:hypothetical protein